VHTTFPNKAVDCFAAGLPVLTTEGGELPALLDEFQCGQIYQAGNVESFIDAVLHFCDTPAARKRMGDNARSLYEARFTVEKVYGEMIDCLEQMAYSGAGTRASRAAA
jgi:glycosyltransferase involved in cell wall biosynthesis